MVLSKRDSRSCNRFLTRGALAAFGFREIGAELTLQHTIDAADFLLFAQLRTVFGHAVLLGAMLTGTRFELALQNRADGALFRKRSVPSRELAFWTKVTSHFVSPCDYMRRRLGGRQPLCGTGVTSAIDKILIPKALVRAQPIHGLGLGP